jgi:general secretion pathway protein C
LLAFSVAASATGWAMRLLARPQPVPSGALPAGRLGVDALADAAPLLFGGHETSAKVASNRPSRFELLGVIGGGSLAGAALIGVDGQPPRAVAVGADAAPGVTLLSTGWREAWLRDGAARIELKMRETAEAGHVAGGIGAVSAEPVGEAPPPDEEGAVPPDDAARPTKVPRPRLFPPPKLPGA